MAHFEAESVGSQPKIMSRDLSPPLIAQLQAIAGIDPGSTMTKVMILKLGV